MLRGVTEESLHGDTHHLSAVPPPLPPLRPIGPAEEYGKTHTKAEGGSTEDSQTVTITNSVTSAVPA
jgi:hypothetical protein